MNSLLEVKKTLNEKIDSLYELINDIKDKKESYEKEKELVESLCEQGDSGFTNKRRRDVIRLYPKLEPLFGYLDSVKTYRKKIANAEFAELDINEVVDLIKLSKCNILEMNSLIEKYEFCKKLYPIVTKPTFEDEAIKESVNGAYKTLSTIMQNLYYSIVSGIKNIIKKEFNDKYFNYEENASRIEEIFEQIEELKKFDIFDDKGNIARFFESKEQLLSFYSWMKDNVDINLQLEIIPLITKYGIVSSFQQIDEKTTKEIEQNREEVIQQLQGNLSIEYDVDFSLYNDEEREVIIEGIKLYEELKDIVYKRTSIISKEDKTERDTMYLYDNTYNWDIILCDIEENILPFMNEDKETTLSVFKLIKKIRIKEKEDLEKRKLIINEIISAIEEYEELRKFANKYSNNQYDYVIENNISEDSSEYPNGVPIEQIKMNYFLNHNIKDEIERLKKLKGDIEKSINSNKVMTEEFDGINIEEFDNIFDKFYEKALGYVEVFKEILQGTYNRKEKETESETTQNLVFCIPGTINSDNSEYKDDFRKTYELIVHRKNWTLCKQLHELWKKNVTGNRRESYKIPFVKMKRIRPLGDTRVGIIKFDVSEKILKILKERYNLGEDATIYGMINAITPGSNHKPYSELTKTISAHLTDITNIGQMLNDPKPDFNKIFQIIDEGIRETEIMLQDEEVKKYE